MAVETGDKMQDRQVIAKVRKHFRDASPQMQVPR
jgi:hypothetical protein